VKKPFGDRAVVITGASDGIGAELARQFAQQGAWLALGARRPHELDVVAQGCIARGGRAIIVPTDVTDPAQCEHLIARALEAYGKVDALVNNAGVGAHFSFDDATDLSVFEQVMRVNYLGSVYCTHFALPALKKSKGRIAVISSLAGKTGVPGRAAYAASKHAVQGFFDSLRIELAPTGVTVTVVSPGFVRTNIRKHALGGDGQPRDEEPGNPEATMPLQECARRTIAALATRKREIVMRRAWKLSLILKVLAPGVVDGMAARTVDASEKR
jgi:NAD(P)-dependent dehydrogenase (short-subunit alcohol dehydrogenase family)